ncbi:2'-deoxycytidine 5'-triphosphate deaminase [Candidatus Berkelbacteria bacterium]|nr:2'-deoxycytidine 5'-triphosphate deaminase [Candidatus Berkelbacteria bacterium]
MTHGALPSQEIAARSADGQLLYNNGPLPLDQIQPASYDVTLGTRAWCVKATFLPGPDQTVTEALERYSLYSFSLRRPSVLTVDSTFVIELRETARFPTTLSAVMSPKSSSGRINLWVRILVDGHSRFDELPAGYHGPIYAIVTPKSWPVKLVAGDSLAQLRLFEGPHQPLDTQELRFLNAADPLAFTPEGSPITDESLFTTDGLMLTANLQGNLVAYQAKHSMELLDLSKVKGHDPDDFFQPIFQAPNRELILKAGEFYILPSYEYLRVPIQFAAEAVAYDIAAGEFRSHYAGFFDPGWGCDESSLGMGAPIVLEIIPHETVILRHRQPVCKTIFERLTAPSDRPYGVGVKSNYHGQRGPRLSKHFRDGVSASKNE